MVVAVIWDEKEKEKWVGSRKQRREIQSIEKWVPTLAEGQGDNLHVLRGKYSQ